MNLTTLKINSAIKEVKATAKAKKLFDGRGLYLDITKTGGTRWRFKYRFAGKEKLISLGVYPDISLKDARDLHQEARTQVAKGINPSDIRKATKEAKAESNAFETIAREWWERNKHSWSNEHGKDKLRRLELNIFPWIGKTDVTEITAPLVLEQLRRIEDRGAVEMAHRVKSIVGEVLRYAIATGRAEVDVTAFLKGALKPVKSKNHATITDPKLIGKLLNDIENYHGNFTTKTALKMLPYVFVRPGELRNAKWSEFDLEKAEWRIPAERMKRRIQHIVPLPKQVVALLKDLHTLTCRSEFVFVSPSSNLKPISDGTINKALRAMGYSTKEEITGHGFRSMASTLLNEMGYNPDAIERQLAHQEGNKVRAAYNHAQHLQERIKMMQEWADYLDGLKNET